MPTLRTSDACGEQTDEYEYGHDEGERHRNSDTLFAYRERNGDAGKTDHRKGSRP